MPQQPKLRKKKVGKSVYWFTKTGGETYFGNVDAVPYSEAKKLFSEHVKNILDSEASNKRRGLTAGDLIVLFLDWIKKKRSQQTFTSRKIYCTRFAAFKLGPQKTRIADLPADKVRGQDLEAWLEHLEVEMNLGAQTRRHAETSVKHCWNWATKHPSPTPHLSPTFRPFSSVERTPVPLKALTENDLITPKEIQAVFAAAKMDLDQFRRFGLEKPLVQNGSSCHQSQVYSDFSDMLSCYYHTGARTDELVSCEVGDVLLRTRQVILGKHKRSRTQGNPTVRHIILNDEAFEILQRNCQGKELSDRVFLNSDGKPWTVRCTAKRFERIKQVAATMKLGKVRDHISIYDFRHLWISDALMARNDVATVAKMAGTSIAMIERVYGHFRNEHLQEAQNRLDEDRRKRNG